MSEISDTKIPTLFWVVGGVFLLWNIFGCYMYYMDNIMSDAAYVETYGEAMLALKEQYPAWATAGYAIGVWGGLLAAILFLLRKKLAYPIFVVSLLGAIVSFSWMFMTPEAKQVAGSYYWVMPLVVVVVGLIEIWVSKKKIAKGILT